jgi:hypothetical protein
MVYLVETSYHKSYRKEKVGQHKTLLFSVGFVILPSRAKSA